MAGCPGEQAALNVEAEQVIVRRRHGDAGPGSLTDEQLSQDLPGGRILNGMSAAGAVEGVLIVFAGERHPELVQQRPARSGQAGLGLLKLAPRESHWPSLRSIEFHVNEPPTAQATPF